MLISTLPAFRFGNNQKPLTLLRQPVRASLRDSAVQTRRESRASRIGDPTLNMFEIERQVCPSMTDESISATSRPDRSAKSDRTTKVFTARRFRFQRDNQGRFPGKLNMSMMSWMETKRTLLPPPRKFSLAVLSIAGISELDGSRLCASSNSLTAAG